MQHSEESLFVAPYATGQCLGPPFLTIPYTDIFAIQDMQHAELSTLVGFIGSLPFGGRKTDHYLTVFFRESGVDHIAVFKMKQSEKAHAAVCETVDKYRKKQCPCNVRCMSS